MKPVLANSSGTARDHNLIVAAFLSAQRAYMK